MLLKRNDTALVFVDVQGRLAEIVVGSEKLLDRLERLVKGLKVMDVPIVWAEQRPDKLGPTHKQLADVLTDHGKPIAKKSFSCWGEPLLRTTIEALDVRTVLVAGIEAHVCVYQTTADLLRAGFGVEVVADGVSSRDAQDRDVALQKMQQLGAELTTVEMCLFELLNTAAGPEFKSVQSIVK